MQELRFFGFRNLFLEPNDDWQPEDESVIKIYGDKMGEINPRTIEAEAKMFQDLYNTENGPMGEMKVYNGNNPEYNRGLIDFIDRKKELPPGFFKYWGDQMPSNKIAGSKAPIDENFSSKLLDYYYGYKIKNSK